jgi:hypothetical protein
MGNGTVEWIVHPFRFTPPGFDMRDREKIPHRTFPRNRNDTRPDENPLTF